MHPKLIGLAMACLVLFSCDNKSKYSEKDVAFESVLKNAPEKISDSNEPEQIPVGNSSQASADSVAQVNPSAPPKVITPIDWDKKIIKNANLKIEVTDFKSFNESIHRIVKQYGGYVANEQQDVAENKYQTTITFKVPVDQFDAMVNQLPGSEITLEKNITSEDVTAQVTDVKSRLASKKQVWLKYLDFLKSSKNMEEVLQVQNEINSLQEEMEAAEGRIKLLTHQSAMSTITLTFFQIIPGVKPIDNTPTFFSRIKYSLKSGAEWIGDLLITLIALWPFVILIPVAIFVFKKFTSNKKAAV